MPARSRICSRPRRIGPISESDRLGSLSPVPHPGRPPDDIQLQRHLSGSQEYRHPMTSVLPRRTTTETQDVLYPSHFAYRHIGPRRADVDEMLELLGYDSLDGFIDAVVPGEIRLQRPLALPPGRSEREVLQALRGLAGMNRVFRSYIGMGYAGCFTPQVIQRNVLENPGWYTAYTPYQAEIAQGRLEALLNFQTMVSDLTALEIANASLLDEATAAAEAMMMCHRLKEGDTGEQRIFFVSDKCH